MVAVYMHARGTRRRISFDSSANKLRGEALRHARPGPEPLLAARQKNEEAERRVGQEDGVVVANSVDMTHLTGQTRWIT
jgi:hypothetical protein